MNEKDYNKMLDEQHFEEVEQEKERIHSIKLDWYKLYITNEAGLYDDVVIDLDSYNIDLEGKTIQQIFDKVMEDMYNKVPDYHFAETKDSLFLMIDHKDIEF